MLGHESVMRNRPISFIDPRVLLSSSLRRLQTLQNSLSSHFLRITPATKTMINQSYPPDKSACNSPYPFSYSMILMPLEDPLINHSNEISQLSPFRLETIYISQPNNRLLSKRIPALWQIKRQSALCKPFSTFSSPGPGDSKLMFRLIHFWETSINSKGAILIGTKYVTVGFFNHHHPQ
ncbi:hypothetical protein HID58_049576 [Brassica napus]|uniref:Uncharacterized protein n=1 Tax=Brassica napus TaxID=3708 RepID=A0ABQ8B6C7_BRANA|nr:hypothetical protein HID58_049576 [Brassica napus]